MNAARSEALIVVSGSLTYSNNTAIAALALAQGLPSCHGFREAVAEGGLISLGPDLGILTRQSARLVDKILKGARARDLPVEQPDRYVISVNLKTAKALGKWHQTDMPPWSPYVRCWGQSGKHVLAASISEIDPMYGPAVRCKWFRRAGGERSRINVSGL